MPFLEPRCQAVSSTFIESQNELGHLNEKAARCMRSSAKKRRHSYSHTARRHSNKFPSGVAVGAWVTMAFGKFKNQLAMERAAIHLLASSAERGAQQAISDASLDVRYKELAINRARALQLVDRQASLSFEGFVEAWLARARAFMEPEQPRATSPGIWSDTHWIPEALQHQIDESDWEYESDDEHLPASQTL